MQTDNDDIQQASATATDTQPDKKQWRQRVFIKVITNLCRCILAVTFLFSGFVKANDPLGTQYKLQDYLTAWGITPPDFLLLLAAIGIAFFEFALGTYLALGRRRRLTSRITLAFMAVMTLLTIYIAIYNPVSDCGCFGDAIILTNAQTLEKNIFLLIAAIIIARHPRCMARLMPPKIDWIITTIAMVGIIAYAVYALYALPPIDFRPYKVGTDIAEAVNGNAGMEFDVTIVYEKDGKQIELTLDDDDPDSTWTYVETRRKPVENIEQKLINLYVEDDGDDITTDIITDEGDIFLLIAPDLAKADQGAISRINELYDYTTQHENMEFYCITASPQKDKEQWIDHTGAEYIIYDSEERMLKTIVRANPGLVHIHNGIIVNKWSNWNLPGTIPSEE